MFSIIRPSNIKKNGQFRVIQTKIKSHENSTNKKQNKKRNYESFFFVFFSILPVFNIKATHTRKKKKMNLKKMKNKMKNHVIFIIHIEYKTSKKTMMKNKNNS